MNKMTRVKVMAPCHRWEVLYFHSLPHFVSFVGGANRKCTTTNTHCGELLATKAEL